MCFSCIVSSFITIPTAAAPDGAAGSLRLLAGSALHNGRYVAGVAIAMPRGSHTYWKMPGDAGIPPVVSFAGSTNLREAKLLYPTPRRLAEAGLDIFGYRDAIVLPVEAIPSDPTRPVDLHVDLAYAVCNQICIPAHGAADVELKPDDTGPDASVVQAALAAVPVAATPDEHVALSLTPDSGAVKPSWRLAWQGSGAVPEDIFADAPEGYYFTTHRDGPGSWRLVAEQIPDDKPWPVSVPLTLARANRSLVLTEKLDTRSAAR